MRREYRQRAAPRRNRRRKICGKGLFNIVKKVAKNPITQQLIKKDVQNLHGLDNVNKGLERYG